MRKTKPASRKRAPKRTLKKNQLPTAKRATAATVDEYLARVPEPARTTLTKIRALIRSIVPAESTEGISYGIPSFKYKGWLVGYAAFRDHCSFFPGALPKVFLEDSKGFSISKGTIRFPPEKPLPDALITKLLNARIQQNETRQRKK